MIVTTVHGRYRVEEEQAGAFRVTLLSGHADLPVNLIGGQAAGDACVRRAPITLRVGGGFCYSAFGTQQVDCGCNRITAMEP